MVSRQSSKSEKSVRLIKVVLFQLRGHGHSQSDATPNFFLDSKSSILWLSNEISFVSRFFCKISKCLEKEESIIWPNVSIYFSLIHATIFSAIPKYQSSATMYLPFLYFFCPILCINTYQNCFLVLRWCVWALRSTDILDVYLSYACLFKH